MPITAKQLDEMKKSADRQEKDWIKVGLSTCGIAAGADQVFERLIVARDRRQIDIDIQRTGCAGKCYAEPLVEVAVKGMPRVVYGKVTPAVADLIMELHVKDRQLLNDKIFSIKAE